MTVSMLELHDLDANRVIYMIEDDDRDGGNNY